MQFGALFSPSLKPLSNLELFSWQSREQMKIEAIERTFEKIEKVNRHRQEVRASREEPPRNTIKEVCMDSWNGEPVFDLGFCLTSYKMLCYVMQLLITTLRSLSTRSHFKEKRGAAATLPLNQSRREGRLSSKQFVRLKQHHGENGEPRGDRTARWLLRCQMGLHRSVRSA